MSKRKHQRKQQRLAAKDKRDSQRFLYIVIGLTIVLLIILYLGFQASF